MSRSRTFLVSGAVALTGLAIAAPSAPAQQPPEAGCLGVLSSFAGQGGIRDDFAPPPVSGQRLSTIARESGDFGVLPFGVPRAVARHADSRAKRSQTLGRLPRLPREDLRPGSGQRYHI